MTEAEFAEHAVFKNLTTCVEFYETLSDLVQGHITLSRTLLGNLDSCFFDSLAGTVESIRMILLAGRIADAYTLLRRFSETAWLHVYVMLRFEEQYTRLADQFVTPHDSDIEGFIEFMEQAVQQGVYVEEIEEWLSGDSTLPELRVFSQQISSSSAAVRLNLLFDSKTYKQIASRCNDHVHVNFFSALRVNYAAGDLNAQIAWLDQFASDFRHLLTRHVTYVFSIRPEYMGSSDYIDALECGLVPEEGSQYWVAPIVQQVFDELVTPLRADVTEVITQSSGMALR